MRPLCSLVAVAVLAMTAAPAHAQTRMVTRKCDATFFVRIAGEVDGGALRAFNPGIPDVTPPHRLESQGTCGALVPNRCRRRASEVAFGCMGAMAAQPASESNFREQCPYYDPSEQPRMVFDQFNFRLRDKPLEAYLGNYVCAAANDWYERHAPNRFPAAVIRYEIHGRVWGDTGCGGGDARSKTEKLATHTMTCPLRPGTTSDAVLMNTGVFRASDGRIYTDLEYRGFNLPQPDFRLCRKACLDDARCMTWQYSPDSGAHPGPYCKLIDHYPQRRTVEGVVSGMK